MEPKSNIPLSPLSFLPYTTKASSASNPLLATYYTLLKMLITNLFVGLNELGKKKASITKDTNAALLQLLDYVSTYPNDVILYRASGMVLAGHSDAA